MKSSLFFVSLYLFSSLLSFSFNIVESVVPFYDVETGSIIHVDMNENDVSPFSIYEMNLIDDDNNIFITNQGGDIVSSTVDHNENDNNIHQTSAPLRIGTIGSRMTSRPGIASGRRTEISAIRSFSENNNENTNNNVNNVDNVNNNANNNNNNNNNENSNDYNNSFINGYNDYSMEEEEFEISGMKGQGYGVQPTIVVTIPDYYPVAVPVEMNQQKQVPLPVQTQKIHQMQPIIQQKIQPVYQQQQQYTKPVVLPSQQKQHTYTTGKQ